MTEGRTEFVGEFVEGLIKAGCSHQEVCEAVAMTADILDLVSGSEMHPADFVKNASKKESITGTLAGNVPWREIAGVFGSIGNAGMHTAGNIASRLVEGAANNVVPLAILGPLAAGVAGYGAGQVVSGMGDDPDDRIREIKHQELMTALRNNTRRLKGVQRQPLPEVEPKKKKPEPAPATEEQADADTADKE